jgi:hypothetical protein
MTSKKTLQPTNDLFLQFTEDEITELGWEPNQKLEVKLHDDGTIELRPYVKVELDMEEWPRETLEMIIKKSLDEDISVNDAINNMLKEALKDYKLDETTSSVPDRELLLEETLDKGAVDPNFTNNDTSICNTNI